MLHVQECLTWLTAVFYSGILAHNLVPKVFDQILDTYKLPDKAQQRSALLQTMGELIKAMQQTSDPLAKAALSTYREEVLSLCASNLDTSSTQEQALFCLAQLSEVPDCLSKDELTYAVQCITDALVKPPAEGSEDMAASSLEALATLADLRAPFIEEITLPPLFQLLPDSAPSQESGSATAEYKVALAALAKLCLQPALFETLLIRLLGRIELLCTTSTESQAQAQQTVLYAHHLLTTLRVVIEKKVAAGHLDLQTSASRVLHRLCGLFIGSCIRRDRVYSAGRSPRLLTDAGKIVTLLVQRMDERCEHCPFMESLFCSTL